MRWLTRAVLRSACPSFALVAGAFVLSSCGGSGSAAPSPFQGSFSGSWTSNGADSGTATVKVSPGGSFTGQEADTTTNVDGSVVGELQNDGDFKGTVQVTGHSAIAASGQFQISADQNTMTGTLTYSSVTYTFTFTRQV